MTWFIFMLIAIVVAVVVFKAVAARARREEARYHIAHLDELDTTDPWWTEPEMATTGLTVQTVARSANGLKACPTPPRVVPKASGAKRTTRKKVAASRKTGCRNKQLAKQRR